MASKQTLNLSLSSLSCHRNFAERSIQHLLNVVFGQCLMFQQRSGKSM